MEGTQGPLRNRLRQCECIAPLKIDMSVTKIRGCLVDHAAHSITWSSMRSGTGAELPYNR